jgi:hypothetical protein
MDVDKSTGYPVFVDNKMPSGLKKAIAKKKKLGAEPSAKTEAEQCYIDLRKEWLEFFEYVIWPDISAGPGLPSLDLMLCITHEKTQKMATSQPHKRPSEYEVDDFVV